MNDNQILVSFSNVHLGGGRHILHLELKLFYISSMGVYVMGDCTLNLNRLNWKRDKLLVVFVKIGGLCFDKVVLTCEIYKANSTN